MLDRREFVQQLLLDRGDLLVVPGLGSATYDVAAAGDHPLNFSLWGAMGGTAMIALGLALARPDRRVVAIPGDGDMLMGLGSLATIGVKQPNNLVVHLGDPGTQLLTLTNTDLNDGYSENLVATVVGTAERGTLWSPYYYITIHEVGRRDRGSVSDPPVDVRTMTDPPTGDAEKSKRRNQARATQPSRRRFANEKCGRS